MDDTDRNIPATKGDLQDLEERMNAAMQELEDRLVEAFRDGQTELLKAFYSFAESTQQRLTGAEAESAALKARLGTLESRLTAVEKRLNMPPAA
jgi:chromosome segregation ATPase